MSKIEMDCVNISDYISPNFQNLVVLDWFFFSTVKERKFWNLLCTSKYLNINLQGIDIFKTDGITWLLSILLQRKLSGYFTSIRLPSELKYLSFLSRIGFLNYQWMFNYQFENENLIHFFNLPTADSLMKIFVIRGDDYYSKIKLYAPLIEEYLAKKENIRLHTFESEGLEETFTGFMEEWVRNIATYGYPQNENFIENELEILGMLSVSLKIKEYPWTRIVMTDIGPGLRKTLLSKKGDHNYYNNCKNDLDAIYNAVMYRKYFIKDRVFGIYSALGFIEKNNGIISIRNGNRLVTINLADSGNKEKFLQKYNTESANYEWLISLVTGSDNDLPKIIGTQICIDLNLQRGK